MARRIIHKKKRRPMDRGTATRFVALFLLIAILVFMHFKL
jgi:hypothetical protein